MNETEKWKANHVLTIKVALMCIFLGGVVIFIFDGSWLTFFGSLFVILGFVAFFFTYTIKKKYLQPTNSQTNLKGELK